MALRARWERWSQPGSPSSPSTPEQPSPALAGPGSLPPGTEGISSWARVGVGRFLLRFGLCALGTVRLPRYVQPDLADAVLSRSRGGSPKVPGVLGAGSGFLRPRDRFVYKHWRALRVRDLLVTTSCPANTGTQRPGRHRLPPPPTGGTRWHRAVRSVSPSRHLGPGHIALKSPRSASAAPGQGNRGEFLPGRFPAPPQRPCQGVGANSVARPAAGPSAEGPSPELAPAASCFKFYLPG